MKPKRRAVGAAAIVALLRTRWAKDSLNKVMARLPGNWPEIPDTPPKPQDREKPRPQPEEPPKAAL